MTKKKDVSFVVVPGNEKELDSEREAKDYAEYLLEGNEYKFAIIAKVIGYVEKQPATVYKRKK